MVEHRKSQATPHSMEPRYEHHPYPIQQQIQHPLTHRLVP